jgi:hypothetical protein
VKTQVVEFMLELGMDAKAVLLYAMTHGSLSPTIITPILSAVLHEENGMIFAMTHFDYISSSGCIEELHRFLELFDEMELLMNLSVQESKYLSTFLLEEELELDDTGAIELGCKLGAVIILSLYKSKASEKATEYFVNWLQFLFGDLEDNFHVVMRYLIKSRSQDFLDYSTALSEQVFNSA